MPVLNKETYDYDRGTLTQKGVESVQEFINHMSCACGKFEKTVYPVLVTETEAKLHPGTFQYQTRDSTLFLIRAKCDSCGVLSLIEARDVFDNLP